MTLTKLRMLVPATTLALAVALVAAAVPGAGVRTASAQPGPPAPKPGQSEAGLVLTNVSGTLLQGTQEVGELTDGTLTITRLQARGGELLADGTLTGTAQGQPVTQSFRDIPVSLVDPNGGACDILNLDLGPLNLDVLGLVVDLSAVALDVTAVPGPGNLLGNLLCAVAGLLDQDPTGGLGGILNELLGIINRLLSGLG